MKLCKKLTGWPNKWEKHLTGKGEKRGTLPNKFASRTCIAYLNHFDLQLLIQCQCSGEKLKNEKVGANSGRGNNASQLHCFPNLRPKSGFIQSPAKHHCVDCNSFQHKSQKESNILDEFLNAYFTIQLYPKSENMFA